MGLTTLQHQRMDFLLVRELLCMAQCSLLQNFIVIILCYFAVSPEGSIIILPFFDDPNLGDTQTFSCRALGGPGNTFSWTRLSDGRIVGNTSSLSVIAEGEDEGGGEYFCEVTNLAGSDSSTVTLSGEDC